MSRLHVAFGVCAVVIALGHVVRRVFLRGPDGPQKISLVGALLINVTLPATVVGAVMRVRRLELEGLVTAALGVSFDGVLYGTAWALFCWLPGVRDPRWRATAPASTSGMNVGLFFYPLIESIAGVEGVVKAAWLDMLNLVFIFTVYPTSYALARRPPKPPSNDNNRTASQASVALTVPEPPASAPAEENPAGSLGKTSQQSPTRSEDAASREAGQQTPAGAAGQEDTAKPSMRQLGKKIGIRVGTSPPLWAMAIGLALGLSGVDLPEFLRSLRATIASANSVLSFFLIGLMLDLRPKTLKMLFRPVLLSLALRYSVGLSLGFTLHYTLGTLPAFSPLGRFVLLIGFVMPTPVVTTVYAREWGWDPALPSLMVTLTIVISFVLVWILTVCVGFPQEVQLTSSSSSLGN
eukprot:m51a1_g13491 hypothetical protein (408) ;mRNA; f:495-1718